MSTTMKVVTAYYSALAAKDKVGIRSTLSDAFSFKGPMMAFDNPDTFAEAMVGMPIEGTPSDSRFIAEGDRVAHVCSWKMTAPVRAEIPMCEIITLAKGKIVRSELFFDSKLFPAG